MGFEEQGWLDVAIKMFYAPLIWCHNHVSWVRQFYDWYGDLFGVR